jgi:hypothetical protein
MRHISCNEGMSGRLYTWKNVVKRGTKQPKPHLHGKIKCSPDRAIIDETKSNETYNFITGISELSHLDILFRQ